MGVFLPRLDINIVDNPPPWWESGGDEYPLPWTWLKQLPITLSRNSPMTLEGWEPSEKVPGSLALLHIELQNWSKICYTPSWFLRDPFHRQIQVVFSLGFHICFQLLALGFRSNKQTHSLGFAQKNSTLVRKHVWFPTSLTWATSAIHRFRLAYDFLLDRSWTNKIPLAFS